MEKKILVEVSARHIHLSLKDVEAIFGKGYQLKKKADLYQLGDFACEETLDVSNGNKKISEVRIVGPARKETQIELSKTDAFYLEINPFVRLSGDLKGSLGIDLIGPKGAVKLKKGVIISKRHIHCNKKEAEEMGLKDKTEVSVKIEGDRGLIFNNVSVRVGDDYRMSMHIDTDEGNAAGINKKTFGIIL